MRRFVNNHARVGAFSRETYKIKENAVQNG